MAEPQQLSRLFISFPLSIEVKDTLGKLQTLLPASFFKPLPIDNLHMTLAFLGDTPGSALPILEDLLNGLASRFPPFLCELSGMGAFPNPWEPRVVWAGIDVGGTEAALLSETLRKELKRASIFYDPKPFRPHITIAYTRKSLTRTEVREAGGTFLAVLKTLGSEKSQKITHTDEAVRSSLSNQIQSFPRISFRIPEIHLVKSELRPQGAVHSPILQFKLKNQPE